MQAMLCDTGSESDEISPENSGCEGGEEGGENPESRMIACSVMATMVRSTGCHTAYAL